MKKDCGLSILNVKMIVKKFFAILIDILSVCKLNVSMSFLCFISIIADK